MERSLCIGIEPKIDLVPEDTAQQVQSRRLGDAKVISGQNPYRHAAFNGLPQIGNQEPDAGFHEEGDNDINALSRINAVARSKEQVPVDLTAVGQHALLIDHLICNRIRRIDLIPDVCIVCHDRFLLSAGFLQEKETCHLYARMSPQQMSRSLFPLAERPHYRCSASSCPFPLCRNAAVLLLPDNCKPL